MRVTLYRDHPAEGWPSMDRYADSLLAALRETAPSSWQFTVATPPGPWRVPYGQILRRMLSYPTWARRQQGDINHVLDHSYGHLLFALDPVRTVVTVHDMAPLRFPNSPASLSRAAWRLAWRGTQKADALIAVSAFTAAEVRSLSRRPPKRLYVAPQGVSPRFRPGLVAQRALIREQYLAEGGTLLLHVGHSQTRKNLPTLLRCLALLTQQGMLVTLLQVGGRLSAAQIALIEQLGLKQAVRLLGPVSDDDLVAYYNAADAFVFPSLYEGFGLPVLEAMACATPVVAANAASLPEVVGDAGVLFDPRSAEALAEAVMRVLREPGLADELRRRGVERARQFTWQRTAMATLKVYESMAGPSSSAAASSSGRTG